MAGCLERCARRTGPQIEFTLTTRTPVLIAIASKKIDNTLQWRKVIDWRLVPIEFQLIRWRSGGTLKYEPKTGGGAAEMMCELRNNSMLICINIRRWLGFLSTQLFIQFFSNKYY